MHAPADGAAAMDEPKTILLVEDEVLIRMLLADELVDSGFRVIQAANGDEAVIILQSSIRLDMVITDVRMPGSVDGLQLAVWARAGRPRIKIVLMSGHLSSAPAGVPADLFVAKPFGVNSVMQKVAELLSGDGDEGR